jgi:spectrin beta
LEKAMAFYEFAFEVDAQKQWILDKLPLAKSEAVGQSLHEAQSLDKKHKKLVGELNGHEKSIEKTINKGHALISAQHPNSGQVRRKIRIYFFKSLNLNSNRYFHNYSY